MKLILLVTAIFLVIPNKTYASFFCYGENEKSTVTIIGEDVDSRVMINSPLKGWTMFSISKRDAIHYEINQQSVKIYNKDEPNYEFKLQFDFNSQFGSLYINLFNSDSNISINDIHCEKR